MKAQVQNLKTTLISLKPSCSGILEDSNGYQQLVQSKKGILLQSSLNQIFFLQFQSTIMFACWVVFKWVLRRSEILRFPSFFSNSIPGNHGASSSDGMQIQLKLQRLFTENMTNSLSSIRGLLITRGKTGNRRVNLIWKQLQRTALWSLPEDSRSNLSSWAQAQMSQATTRERYCCGSSWNTSIHNAYFSDWNTY